MIDDLYEQGWIHVEERIKRSVRNKTRGYSASHIANVMETAIDAAAMRYSEEVHAGRSIEHAMKAAHMDGYRTAGERRGVRCHIDISDMADELADNDAVSPYDACTDDIAIGGVLAMLASGMSQAEIARVRGVSKQRISTIVKKERERIKRRMRQ